MESTQDRPFKDTTLLLVLDTSTIGYERIKR